jgi:hypothetical protein
VGRHRVHIKRLLIQSGIVIDHLRVITGRVDLP